MKVVPIKITKHKSKTKEGRHSDHADISDSSMSNNQGSKGKTIEDQLSNRNKNYRIMILPWPEFTDAYKSNSSTKGGNAIFGKRLTQN